MKTAAGVRVMEDDKGGRGAGCVLVMGKETGRVRGSVRETKGYGKVFRGQTATCGRDV